MTFTSRQLQRARRLLCELQRSIRDTLILARERQSRDFARIAAVTEADTIYHIDKLSEEAILVWMEQNWPKTWPVELVMEGIEQETTFPTQIPIKDTVWKLIIDPIDGTRCIMYDKRSAWALAGLAPQRGRRTALSDIVVAAMTELPTSKQGHADVFSAVKGGGLRTERVDLSTGEIRRWTARPSQATGFEHGFASFVKFFPEGKVWLAQLEEKLWAELGLLHKDGGQQVFDDQYISTGGQLYELLCGHDRMLADLRPLAFQRLGFASALCCHPYDLCTALLLTEAGGVVEHPLSGTIKASLDTTTPISWVGYANRKLATRVRPVLRRLLNEATT